MSAGRQGDNCGCGWATAALWATSRFGEATEHQTPSGRLPGRRGVLVAGRGKPGEPGRLYWHGRPLTRHASADRWCAQGDYEKRTGCTERLIGRARRWTSSVEEIARVARSDAKVLITGESGVGKEIVARVAVPSEGRDRTTALLGRKLPGLARKRCSSPSFFATSKAASPARIATSPASSRWPIRRERSSSMKSAK